MRRSSFLLPVMLAGCGAPAPDATPTANTATPASSAAAKVAALSPQLRAGVMLRAIRDAGQDCQQVVAADRAQAAGGPLAWIATCEDHRRWVVAIAGDGTATVTDANLVARPPDQPAGRQK